MVASGSSSQPRALYEVAEAIAPVASPASTSSVVAGAPSNLVPVALVAGAVGVTAYALHRWLEKGSRPYKPGSVGESCNGWPGDLVPSSAHRAQQHPMQAAACVNTSCPLPSKLTQPIGIGISLGQLSSQSVWSIVFIIHP